jgi:hypothetical protein
MACASTPSSEASPARIFQWQDLAADWKAIEADFTARSSGSSASFDRASCSWKTSQASESTPTSLSETWPAWGMTLGGKLYRLPKSERRTNESDGGSSPLLPTPTASQYGSSQNGSNSGRPSGGTPSLATRVAKDMPLWPTPTVADSRATGVSHDGTTLTDALRSRTGNGKALLSPRFVEWLMGVPLDWTVCASWATALSPSKLDKPSSTSADWNSDETEASDDGQLDLF